MARKAAPEPEPEPEHINKRGTQAQRELKNGWIDKHIDAFDVEKLGYPLVNRRADGHLYIIDGQNRVELVRRVGWGDQMVQVEYFDGLTQAEEAALFLARNDRTAVGAYDKFRVRVTAGEPVASDIDRIVRAQGLAISKLPEDGHIAAVGALEKVYRGAGLASLKEGPRELARTLNALVKSWGPAASTFNGKLIEGMGLVCIRYGTAVDVERLATKLGSVSGGAPGILGRGKSLKELRGRTLDHCVASIIVDVYNQGGRSGRLDDWWS